MAKHNRNRFGSSENETSEVQTVLEIKTEEAEKTDQTTTESEETASIECPGFAGVYLRSGPDTEHDPLLILRNGDKVDIQYRGPNWSTVGFEHNGIIVFGYVQTRFLV